MAEYYYHIHHDASSQWHQGPVQAWQSKAPAGGLHGSRKRRHQKLMFSQGQKYGPTGSPMVHTELGPFLATISTAKMLAACCARSPAGPARLCGLNHLLSPVPTSTSSPSCSSQLNFCVGWEVRDHPPCLLHLRHFEKANSQSPTGCDFFPFSTSLGSRKSSVLMGEH